MASGRIRSGQTDCREDAFEGQTAMYSSPSGCGIGLHLHLRVVEGQPSTVDAR